MNVLSLFDGISCGHVALERAGIKIDKYYASEIDKHAIKIAQKNYPETIQLGDVREIKAENLPKIDLLIGGSPCQGFSFAGKQLNFDDPRSKLFFEFVRLLKECKPKYFLLENVRMKKEFQEVISKELGVYPVQINSALVSAQNRVRLYWTNIPGYGGFLDEIPQPKDKGIMLKDILEDGIVDKEKSFCIDANYFKGGNLKSYFEKNRRQLVFIEQTAHGFNKGGIFKDKTPALTSSSWEHNNKLCIQVGEADLNGNDSIKRVYSTKAKAPCLTTCCGGNQEPKITNDLITWRKLTPIECERLQTLPDNYTDGVSNSQRYRALGNGWTVDVVAHIFNFIPKA